MAAQAPPSLNCQLCSLVVMQASVPRPWPNRTQLEQLSWWLVIHQNVAKLRVTSCLTNKPKGFKVSQPVLNFSTNWTRYAAPPHAAHDYDSILWSLCAVVQGKPPWRWCGQNGMLFSDLWSVEAVAPISWSFSTCAVPSSCFLVSGFQVFPHLWTWNALYTGHVV